MLVSPGKLFLALATIPLLKKLNLSRNKLKRFHSEDLPEDNKLMLEEEEAIVPDIPSSQVAVVISERGDRNF